MVILALCFLGIVLLAAFISIVLEYKISLSDRAEECLLGLAGFSFIMSGIFFILEAATNWLHEWTIPTWIQFPNRENAIIGIAFVILGTIIFLKALDIGVKKNTMGDEVEDIIKE